MVGPWRGSVARATPFGLSRDEYVQTLAKRISYSRAYTAFYISVIAAALLEVGWIVFPGGAASSDGSASAAAPLSRPAGHLPSSRLFSAVESYVTLGLLAELGVRAAMQQRGFWSHRANWLDIGVAAVSLLTSLLLMLGLETPSEMLLAEALIGTRVVFRLARLLSISHAFSQQQQAAGHKLDLRIDACGVYGGGGYRVDGFAAGEMGEGFDEEGFGREEGFLEEGFHGARGKGHCAGSVAYGTERGWADEDGRYRRRADGYADYADYSPRAMSPGGTSATDFARPGCSGCSPRGHEAHGQLGFGAAIV